MKPKFMFAPDGYRQEWQHAPRGSGLPIGYFDQPLRLTRGRIVAMVVAAVLAVAVLAITAGDVMDEAIHPAPTHATR